jgi:RHS repeat-associated protein
VLGRLSSRTNGDIFRFHYDEARTGASSATTNLIGNLAWIEEPTGYWEAGYDAFGKQVYNRRQIDGRASELTTMVAPSGLVRARTYDDGFTLSYSYDPAGRLIGVANLWQLLEQDASGQVLHERTQNGVDTRYERDLLRLPSKVTVKDATGQAIYDVEATRNEWSALTTVNDVDHVGLDHSAQFGYDGFARLTSASVGTGTNVFSFGYGYDVLHNMTSRTTTGPRALSAFFGTYHHGASGKAPRQLSSITNAAGVTTHTFDYDAAGRQVRQDDLVMTYDATDRLLRVDGLSGGAVEHRYGHDGQRVKTTTPGSIPATFFGDGTAERNGVREHDVVVGDRVVARVAVAPGASLSNGGGAAAWTRGVATAPLRDWSVIPWLICLVAGLLAWSRGRMSGAAIPSRLARRHGLAVLLIGSQVLLACSSSRMSSGQQANTIQAVATYQHSGFGLGPVLFTNSAGQLLEERRNEPFGEGIDARTLTAGGYVVGDPDLVARDLNSLNKRTEVTTGWSDHGARWMAPETARWLSTDPPVTAPDASFMDAPWALHPYQYVNQNPVIYWDPDGRQPASQGFVPDEVKHLQRFTKPYTELYKAAEPVAAAAVVAGNVALDVTPFVGTGRAIARGEYGLALASAVGDVLTVVGIAGKLAKVGVAARAMEGGGAAAATQVAVSAAEGSGEMVSLYRAVGDAELDVIRSTGRIPESLSGLEVKYFSATAEGASSFAKQAVHVLHDPPYTLVEAQIQRCAMPADVLIQVDRNVPAVVLPNTHLPLLGPAKVWSSMPVP